MLNTLNATMDVHVLTPVGPAPIDGRSGRAESPVRRYLGAGKYRLYPFDQSAQPYFEAACAQRGVALSSMPATLLIGRDGKLRYVNRGYRAGYEKQYEAEIRELLKQCCRRASHSPCCALSRCSPVARIKPYEREMLADPIMGFSRDALSDQYLEHVREVREGARGATSSQGGGCGCN